LQSDPFPNRSVIVEDEVVMLDPEGGKEPKDVLCVVLTFSAAVREREGCGGGCLVPRNKPVSSRFNGL
jgi:hypothetical protein